jgi:hypothetical protein
MNLEKVKSKVMMDNKKIVQINHSLKNASKVSQLLINTTKSSVTGSKHFEIDNINLLLQTNSL